MRKKPTRKDTSPAPVPSEKLQKTLAEAGLGSRRALEGWIAAGRVSVNGARATIGARVCPEDIIRVDGRRIARPSSGPGSAGGKRIRVLKYHKPAGEICSRADPDGRRSVFDKLPGIALGRWIAVGRLDINTSGILLFTNSGELAHRLMHPASGMEREYAVRILPERPAADAGPGPKDAGNPRDRGGPPHDNNEQPAGAAAPDSTLLERLQAGIRLEDGLARFERITDAGGQGQNHWYHVILKEGKNHEVRRLWEAVGFRVSRLIRLRYGPVELGRGLRAGRWEQLSEQAVAQLAEAAGLAGTQDSRPPRHSPRGNARSGAKKPPIGRSRRKRPIPAS